MGALPGQYRKSTPPSQRQSARPPARAVPIPVQLAAGCRRGYRSQSAGAADAGQHQLFVGGPAGTLCTCEAGGPPNSSGGRRWPTDPSTCLPDAAGRSRQPLTRSMVAHASVASAAPALPCFSPGPAAIGRPARRRQYLAAGLSPAIAGAGPRLLGPPRRRHRIGCDPLVRRWDSR